MYCAMDGYLHIFNDLLMYGLTTDMNCIHHSVLGLSIPSSPIRLALHQPWIARVAVAFCSEVLHSVLFYSVSL